MELFDITEAAQRAGVSLEEMRRLVERGIVTPDAGGSVTRGDVLRASLVESLLAAGIPFDGLSTAIQNDQVSLDFLDQPAYERFSTFTDVTFGQLAERSGVPVDLLMLIREAAGSSPPRPDDRLREGELPYAEFIAVQIELGFEPIAVQRLLRAGGDSLRRLAETEGEWWRSQVILPALRAGRRPDDELTTEISERLGSVGERAFIELYRLEQSQAWTANIISALEMMLSQAGLHSRLEHPPAMCFLDITGYTRLTQEWGDAAAATLATDLARRVERTSVLHGGRPVKWLGDGVMFFFKDPAPGVAAALDMVDGVLEAGLPPAHVGLHAGPVIFQEGDYYGQTVNVASRIADYARPGEVLVSQDVVEASRGAAVEFREIGPVELKGLAGPMHLFAAGRLS